MSWRPTTIRSFVLNAKNINLEAGGTHARINFLEFSPNRLYFCHIYAGYKPGEWIQKF